MACIHIDVGNGKTKTGACLNSCDSSAQCVLGYICNSAGLCITPPSDVDPAAGCSIPRAAGLTSSSGTSPGRWWWLIALGGLIGALRVRRRGLI